MQGLSFEQGPIRPPSEARSLLLRVTRGCSWNQCLFCSVYKDQKFERRSVDEVRADIDTVCEIIREVKSVSWQMGLSGSVNAPVANRFLEKPHVDYSAKSVVVWLYYGTNAVFLQDANNLILQTDDLVQMLEYLNEKVSGISRITTYSRSNTAARKSLDDLKRIRAAGLNRVHIGLESASDRVLKFMKKGVNAAAHIKAGRNIVEAGMELSEYYMPGLGGRALWREHTLETARVVNAIDPHFIRLRTLHVAKTLPLHRWLEAGTFELRSPDEVVEEIRLFIESLEGIHSRVVSDHIGNMIQDVEGKLPEDKDKMLDALDRYLRLGREERLHYQVGRIMGLYNGVPDMGHPARQRQVEEAVGELKTRFGGGLEQALVQLHDQVMR